MKIFFQERLGHVVILQFIKFLLVVRKIFEYYSMNATNNLLVMILIILAPPNQIINAIIMELMDSINEYKIAS